MRSKYFSKASEFELMRPCNAKLVVDLEIDSTQIFAGQSVTLDFDSTKS